MAADRSPLGTKKLNVLLVEDSADYASLVVRWLSGESNETEFVTNWTDSLAAALARLEQGAVDLILLDLVLPDSDGLDTFASIRAKASDLPIIILSSGDSEALALQTIQLGAQDYLVKSSCTPELLIRSLCHAVVRHQSTKRQSHAEESSAQARVVGVLGGTGGAGATTVACVLAAELRHHTDETTLLMDLDSNPGLVAFTMGIVPGYTVQDAMELGDHLDRSSWDDIVVRRPGHLDILASSNTMNDGDLNMEALRKVFGYARSSYRWIVMDLGRLSRASQHLLGWANDIILVSAQSIPALHQCKHAIAVFHDLGIERERVRLVLNHTPDADRLSRKAIENLFGIPVDAVLPVAHDDLYSACLKKRLPSVTGDFRVALAAVARRMAGLPAEVPKRSLLSLTSIRDKLRHRGEATKTLAAS